MGQCVDDDGELLCDGGSINKVTLDTTLYSKDRFSFVDFPHAEDLVMKVSGGDIIFRYLDGTAHVNKQGTIAYASLLRCCFLVAPEARELPESETLLGNVYLFYSKSVDGKEILTIPGWPDPFLQNAFLEEEFPGKIIGGYNWMPEGLPSVKEAYAFHLQAIGGRELVADRSLLEKEVLQLVTKVNKVYADASKILEEYL